MEAALLADSVSCVGGLINTFTQRFGGLSGAQLEVYLKASYISKGLIH